MLTQILAASGLLICIALAVRMALRPPLQRRVDQALLRAYHRLAWRLREAWQTLTHWRRRSDLKKAAAAQAAAAAAAAIKRAKDKPAGEWDGNVYRPKSFEKKPDGDKLH